MTGHGIKMLRGGVVHWAPGGTGAKTECGLTVRASDKQAQATWQLHEEGTTVRMCAKCLFGS